MVAILLRRVARALGLACLHVLLFAVFHGVIGHMLAREIPTIYDTVIEIASEAMVYEF